MMVRHGGCRCGRVRYTVAGEPEKTGLCHCTDCRKETGSAFLAYADWSRNTFSVTGEYTTYEGRSFCPVCGTRLFHVGDDYAEICIGSLDDAPTGLAPMVEGWCIRREQWLPVLAGVPQYRNDPPGG
jgi:hypothetical protein